MKTLTRKRFPLCAAVALLTSMSAFAHFPIFESDEKPSLAPILESMKDAVVNISVTMRQGYSVTWFDEWGRFDPRRQYREVESAGSGVIIDAERGLIVTNHHVIAQANRVVITLQDRRTFDADFLGSDPTTDIALLQIDAEDLTDLELANSDNLRVGDFVIAIGNPFGIGQTVTSGIVSALGRNELGIVSTEDFIQTDASINPGNSGGGLIDIEGNLIGINTAIISRSGTSSGIGFAIPSNMVRTITDQLIQHGNVKRGAFGIVVEPITQEVQNLLELPTQDGVFVKVVVAGSAADAAGMRIDDVITAVNGKEITNRADLSTTISLLRIGEKFNLSVIRNGNEIQVEGTVQDIETGIELVPGVQVSEIPSTHPHYGRIRGVVVSAIDSRRNDLNLIVDDVILGINRTGISRLSDLDKFNLSSRPLILMVLRGSQQFRMVIR